MLHETGGETSTLTDTRLMSELRFISFNPVIYFWLRLLNDTVSLLIPMRVQQESRRGRNMSDSAFVPHVGECSYITPNVSNIFKPEKSKSLLEVTLCFISADASGTGETDNDTKLNVKCHVIVRNRLSLSMGSRGVAAGANPSLVSG